MIELYIQIQEKDFKNKCPCCDSEDLAVKRTHSNGIVQLKEIRCLGCMSIFDVCPDYEHW